MKALIRKNPDTPTKPAQDEVYLQPWLDWINPETGAPLTDENYGYALCEDVPEGVELSPEDFTVTEHTKVVPAEYPEDEPKTVKYWTAVYTPRPGIT